MSRYLQQYKQIFVLGLGMTGESCLKYLSSKAKEFDLTIVAADTRALAHINQLRNKYPLVEFIESNQETRLIEAELIVASPGISLQHEYLSAAKNAGKVIVGDIELFAAEVSETDVPVIAITGSNGKSTVTDLASKMLSHDFMVAVGGNIGKPALSLLSQDKVDVYVLELSSFQLETTKSLHLLSACIVNITPDHMDRYDSFEHYKVAKLSIFDNAKTVSYCRDEMAVEQSIDHIKSKLESDSISTFSLNKPLTDNEFGIVYKNDNAMISKGDEALINTNELALLGKHNWLNVMATYSLLTTVYQYYGKDMMHSLKQINAILTNYVGLPHRCEKVCLKNEVLWINDSKATNPESSMAALSGFTNDNSNNIIWIVGGEGKGADFSPLKAVIDGVKAIILFGRDGQLIAQAINPKCPILIANTMNEVIEQAKSIAEKGDIVLFSPACASFDMFNNFEHRGDVFKECVIQQVVK